MNRGGVKPPSYTSLPQKILSYPPGANARGASVKEENTFERKEEFEVRLVFTVVLFYSVSSFLIS